MKLTDCIVYVIDARHVYRHSLQVKTAKSGVKSCLSVCDLGSVLKLLGVRGGAVG
jgi:hypothetical protein